MFTRQAVLPGANGEILAVFYDDGLPRNVTVRETELARRYYKNRDAEQNANAECQYVVRGAQEEADAIALAADQERQEKVNAANAAAKKVIEAAQEKQKLAIAPLLEARKALDKEVFEKAELQLVAEARGAAK